MAASAPHWKALSLTPSQPRDVNQHQSRIMPHEPHDRTFQRAYISSLCAHVHLGDNLGFLGLLFLGLRGHHKEPLLPSTVPSVCSFSVEVLPFFGFSFGSLTTLALSRKNAVPKLPAKALKWSSRSTCCRNMALRVT